MVRSLQTVQRSRKAVPLSPPFGGYSSQNDPMDVGPVRAVDARNVVLDDGRIASRFGFNGLDGREAPWQRLPQQGRIESLGAWFDTDYTLSEPEISSRVVAKIIGYPLYDSAALYVGLLFERGLGATWTKVSTGITLAPSTGRFLLLGNRGKHVDSVFSGFDTSMLLLDGGDRTFGGSSEGRMFKVVGSPPRMIRVGMGQPTIAAAAITTPAGLTDYPAGTYSFTASKCNRLLAPEDDPHVSPGLESNAGATGTAVTVTSGQSIKLTLGIFFDDDDDEWTHFRVYRANQGETDLLAIGYFARQTGMLPDDHIATESGIREWELVLTGGVGLQTQASGSGAWDYSPTRNHPPRKFRHFAMYQGRSFWANGQDSKVYYSDPEGPLTGGHREALSNESLDGFDGPVTLLATAFDQLIMGTPNGLYALTGTVTSHTNQSIAQDQDIAMPSAQIDRVETGIDYDGSILDGLGASVFADNALYYISRNGLEMYNGRSVFNVMRTVKDVANRLDVIPESETVIPGGLKEADLVHDDAENRILMLARFPHNYHDVPSELTATFPEPQNVKSVVLCCHYRNRDPETLMPQWTIWDKIGPGLFLGPGQWDETRQTRCSAITVIPRHNARSRIGLANLDGEQISSGGSTFVRYNHPVVMEQDDQRSGDTIGGNPDGFQIVYLVRWRWQSGEHDWNLPDRRKHFWFITATIVSRFPEAQADTAVVRMGFQVDDHPIKTFERTIRVAGIRKSVVKIPVKRAGYTIAVWFGNESVTEQHRFEVLGVSIDAEPIDDF